MGGQKDNDDASRAAANSLRDTGTLDGLELTLHPTEEGEYEAALAHEWGGPGPRWITAAMVHLLREHGERQRGRRALITGGSSGIGFFVAKMLASIGLAVVLPSRPGLEFETRGAAAAIRAALPNATVEVPETPLDLASFPSVRAFSAHLHEGGRPIDVLCLNAGRGGSSRDQLQLTADNEEATMQVNLLGHALLVRELLPSLQRSTYARIVVHTSSARQNAAQSSLSDLRGAGFSDSPFSQYALSKAALCLYARALNTRLASAGVTGAALVADPGLAATGIHYQQELLYSLGLSRRGIKSMRAYMDGYAVHAADGALPMTMAALEGEADEMWLSEPPGPRLTSLDAAAHRAGHLLWQPLRPYDPMLWPAEVAERLWTRVELLASINSTWPKATANAAAHGGGRGGDGGVGSGGKHDEI